MAAADAEQRSVLERVGSTRLDDGDVAAIQDVIVATGALDALEARIAELAAEAVAAVADVDITAEARCRLTELAAFVVARVL
jgi:geranylgeranyl diphosphate synthase type I